MKTELLVFVAWIAAVLSNSAQADISTGLVAHWKFDETSGLVATDSSGKENHATLSNFAEGDPRWVPGRIGGALFFNFNGSDDLVMTEKPIEFDNQDRFTFAFWLRRKEGAPTGNPHLIVPISTHWVLWTPGKGIGFFVPEISTEPLTDVWTHYVVVFDRAGGKYQLFVNGNPELADIPATKDAPGSQQWIIGHNNNVNHPGDPWLGKIDDVRIYNRLLTAEDVAELYQASGEEVPYSPLLLAQPQSKTRFVGENVILTVAVDGSEPLSYRWKKDGQNIANATESSLTFNGLTLNDSGSYIVEVSNLQGTVTSQAAIVQVNPKPVGPDIVTGLIAHWTFDETNGLTVADSSGRGNNSSLGNFQTNGLQWVRGRIGGALWFNAKGSDDLVITDAPIDFDSQDEFTFTFWLKRKEGAPTANPHIIVPVSTHWVLWNPGRGIGFHTTAVNTDPPVNAWTHYAVVFNRASTSYEVYVDGSLVQSDGIAERAEPGSQKWVIGHNNNVDHPGDPWLGGIDDMRIYNRLLTVEDVASLYQAAGEVAPSVPTFIEQPIGAAKTVGENFSVSILADGTEPLSYQWKKDGQNILDATTSTLNLTDLRLEDAGSYTVVVSNGQGAVTSHAAVLQVAPAAAADITTGLIAHWKFDETSGLAAADSSGRGNNASLVNFADGDSQWVPGRIGGALRFNFLPDGEPDPDRDDLVITDAPINFENQNQFAFSFWLKRGSGPTVANPHIIVPVSTHWVLWNPGAGIGFHTTARNSDPPVDEWRHYVVAFNRAAATYTVFVDGVEVQTDAAATRSGPGAQRWVIGHNNDVQHPGDPWFGEIDDMRIYNRLLKRSEAQALYQFDSSPTIRIARSGNNVVITWTGSGTLQSAELIAGPWTDVSAAASPQTVIPSSSAKFYRLMRR